MGAVYPTVEMLPVVTIAAPVPPLSTKFAPPDAPAYVFDAEPVDNWALAAFAPLLVQAGGPASSVVALTAVVPKLVE